MLIDDDDDNDDVTRTVKPSVVFVTSIHELFIPDLTKIHLKYLTLSE